MMHYTKCVVLSVVLLLTHPSSVGGGPVCYVSCLAAVGGTAIVRTTIILLAIGFTSSRITAGSWAATWMASFGGAVPTGGMFASCQPAGMTGVTAKFVIGVTGSTTSVCAAFCALLP